MKNRFVFIPRGLLFVTPSVAGLLLACLSREGAAGDAAPPTERRRLEILARMPREQQRAPENQKYLQGFMRRGALAYLHSLDGLACRALFSLGDPALFAGAFGNTDGSDRDLVFFAPVDAAQHIDDGPYELPIDLPSNPTWYPPSPTVFIYWHEVNHTLLNRAGVVGVNPRPYSASLDNPSDATGLGSFTRWTADYHHPLIEGVGQRGAEAYRELYRFESAMRRAHAMEAELIARGQDVSDPELQRQIWAECHRDFSAFIKAMRRVANIPPEVLAEYRAATGVFFSPVEQVAEFYRKGGMKISQGGDSVSISPPRWVFFPDLPLIPVQILVQEESPAPQAGEKALRKTATVRLRPFGSWARMQGQALRDANVQKTVNRGRLRIKLETDDAAAGLLIAQGDGRKPVDGIATPGGRSTHLFDLDLAAGQPVHLAFVHRRPEELRGAKSYTVKLSYSDPGPDRLYDSSATAITFQVAGAQPAAQKASSAAGATVAGPGRTRLVAPSKVLATELFQAALTPAPHGAAEVEWRLGWWSGFLLPRTPDHTKRHPVTKEFQTTLQLDHSVLTESRRPETFDLVAEVRWPDGRTKTYATRFTLYPVEFQFELPPGSGWSKDQDTSDCPSFTFSEGIQIPGKNYISARGRLDLSRETERGPCDAAAARKAIDEIIEKFNRSDHAQRHGLRARRESFAASEFQFELAAYEADPSVPMIYGWAAKGAYVLRVEARGNGNRDILRKKTSECLQILRSLRIIAKEGEPFTGRLANWGEPDEPPPAGPPQTDGAVAIAIPSETPPVVPAPFTDKPIEPDEIQKHPPPPKTEPPDSKTIPSRLRPVPYSPPDGSYVLHVPPGWQKLPRKPGDRHQLFVSPDRNWVLACPDQALVFPVNFKEFRQALAAAALKGPPPGKVEMLDYGPHCGLVVRPPDEDGRSVRLVYLGGIRRGACFKVFGRPGADEKIPPALSTAWASVKGLTP